MRKFTAVLVAAAASLSLVCTALAAPSIGQLIPESPKMDASSVENLPEGCNTISVSDAKTDTYKNEDVKTAVEELNDDTTKTTIEDVIKILGQENETFETASGKTVNPAEYEALMPFVDIFGSDGTTVSYDAKGDITVEMTLEPAKDLDAENLLIMIVNPDTGEVAFVEIEDYDPLTGTFTVTLPFLGPFTLVTNAPTAEAEAETAAE